MERRIQSKSKIEHALAFIVARVNISSKLNFTDVNIVAEKLFTDLFNLMYGYDLKSANSKKPNESTIDIYFDKEKIAYQITSQNTKRKIKETVDSFIKDNKAEKYKKFVILTVSSVQKCNYDDLDRLRSFEVEPRYMNMQDVMSEIYYESNTSDKLDEIADFLDSETARHKSGSKVNPQSQEDYINELKPLGIIDQMYRALKMFEGFVSIHPRTIAGLYPFNTQEVSYNMYSYGCLKTDNIKIHELLLKIKIENHEVKIDDIDLTQEKEKLEYIFYTLNRSSVRCIAYREEHVDVKHHKIPFIKYDHECKCNECLFYNFNWRPLFAALKGKATRSSEKLDDALNEGYYLSKTGSYIESWRIFDELSKRCSADNNPITYFLSNRNLISLRAFLHGPWFENERGPILERINQIDLTADLCKLTTKKKVRDELQKIKEKFFLYTCREEIDEHFAKIAELKGIYSRGGSSSGQSSVYKIIDELEILFNFYISNNIIQDDFYSFKSIFHKGIEAIIMSHMTAKRFKYRHKAFDNFQLHVMINHIDGEALEKLFKQYKLKTLPMKHSQADLFLNSSNNFFNSVCEKVFFGKVDYNRDLLRQEYFSFFRQSVRHISINFLLLLSMVELSDEKLKFLAQPLVTYFESDDEINHVHWNFFTKFLKRRIQIFNHEQLSAIIEQAMVKRVHFAGERVLEQICEHASTKASFVITDQSFVERMISRVMTFCKECGSVHDPNGILACWSCLNEQDKEVVKGKIFQLLHSQFDGEFFRAAVIKHVISQEEASQFIEQFKEYTESKCSKNDVVIDRGRTTVQYSGGIDCILCMVLIGIPLNDECFQRIASVSNFYNWMINFETYDYTNFDTSLLVNFCPFYMINKLKHIATLEHRVTLELSKRNDSKLSKFYFQHIADIK